MRQTLRTTLPLRIMNRYYANQGKKSRSYNYTLSAHQIRNDYNQGAMRFGP